MEIDKLLSIEGIFRGNSNLGYQYYQVLAYDQEGKKYMMSIGCKLIYQNTVEKSFARLVFIPAPTTEQLSDLIEKETTKEGEINNGIYLIKD